jgi:hypothetical protein
MGQISKIMGSVHGLHSALNHKDVEGLMLNVMILSTPTCCKLHNFLAHLLHLPTIGYYTIDAFEIPTSIQMTE